MQASRAFIFSFVGIVFAASLLSSANASTGNSIRSKAPMTALVYDLQEGNIKELEEAYFEDEIEFFLDYQGVQNTGARELFYLREAGKSIARSDYLSAKNFLRSVQKYPDQKKYLDGVLAAAEGRYEDAMNLFRGLIEKRRSLSRSLVSKSFLGAARVAHEVGDYKQAIFYYTRIKQLDPLFFRAIFEKTWSFYLDGDMNGALGASLSFMSPYSDNVFFPEAWIVRAASFYQLCLFDRASQTIDQMKSLFVALQAQVRSLRTRETSSWLFDERVLSSMDKKLLGYFTQDPVFRSLQRSYISLQKEQNSLGAGERAKAQQALGFVKSKLTQEGARLLGQAYTELDQAVANADSIQIEILQLGVNVLTGAPIEMRDDLRYIQLGDVDFDPQIQFWPFKKEFWLDELGSYYYGLKSQCSAS